ncbi:hypothetical protein TWF191_010348 [Orbilia oligospora]|uniref:Uncharacterized protein n=1 Tax=Orbilia oligospora TaxID=2813651 RepID=A0A7C8UJD9_ORBOL|nr:hypothetical protein TWF191_010348 [Orbilia oligospora]
MSSVPFLKTTRGYSIISETSSVSDDGFVQSPDSELKFEKGLFSGSATRSGFLRRALRTVGPILGVGLAIAFVFACGFHLGGSVAVYNMESRTAGLETSLPFGSNSTSISIANATEVAASQTNEDMPYELEEQRQEEEGGEEDGGEKRALITYVYFETKNARQNALFFIKHGLHAFADFIFIINGPTNIASSIPSAPNIKIIHKNNTCYDLGSHAELLTANDGELMKKYDRFIMMNASIRGPFLPTWSKECWSDAYLDGITESNKLVGMTMRCNADGGKRKVMQSMLYATDRVGLQTLLPVLNHCFATFGAAVGAEEHAAQTMLNAGYNISVLMSSFQSSKDYVNTCTHGEVLGEKWYFGTSLHPYETMFHKANRGISERQLELLTSWHDQAEYSSWEACYNKRRREGRRVWRR